MNKFDESFHIRNLLADGSMMTHEQKIGLIEKIRDNAIIEIVRIRPETVIEGHDLTQHSQSYHFICELRKEDIKPKLAAYLNLLEVCVRTIHNCQIDCENIADKYRKTDKRLMRQ